MKAHKIPIRTRLITHHDDLAAVVHEYTRDVAEPGDVIVVSESVAAIAQGRAIPPEKVRPGRLARLLCRFAHKDGSLATPAAGQLAIQEAGTVRVLLGAAAALAGKALGRKGWFFIVAGRRLALIDDIAGTIPPYDTCIVLGPKEPAKLVARIKEVTGIDAAIADVNDLRRADILAMTGPLPAEELAACLADNPGGNDDQQTPIVIVRPVAGGLRNEIPCFSARGANR